MGGKTSAKSKNAWIEKAYDRINLTVSKGQKDIIKAHAEAKGESARKAAPQPQNASANGAEHKKNNRRRGYYHKPKTKAPGEAKG